MQARVPLLPEPAHPLKGTYRPRAHYSGSSALSSGVTRAKGCKPPSGESMLARSVSRFVHHGLTTKTDAMPGCGEGASYVFRRGHYDKNRYWCLS